MSSQLDFRVGTKNTQLAAAGDSKVDISHINFQSLLQKVFLA